MLEASKPISPPDGGFRELVRDPGHVPWEASHQVEITNGEYQGRGYPQASNYPDYGPGMFDYQYSGLFTMNIDGDSGNQTSKWRRVGSEGQYRKGLLFTDYSWPLVIVHALTDTNL